jgi:hypothetical protein
VVAAGVVLAVAAVSAVAIAAGGGDGGPGPDDEQALGATDAGDLRFDEHLAQRPSPAGGPRATTTSTTVPAGVPGDGTSKGAGDGGGSTASGGNCDPTCTQFPVDIPPPRNDPYVPDCPNRWQREETTGRLIDTGCASEPGPVEHVVVITPPPPPPPVILPETPTTTPPSPPPPPTTAPPTSTPTSAAG